MIVKHVPMRSLGKSNFGELVSYITNPQSKEHRLGQVLITNCEAATLPAAIEEVMATQYINTRAKGDKTYHLIVSFRAGEEPTSETLNAIEDRIANELGYGEHQRVSAVHQDTDNLHIHLAINKIHPARNTMHEPFQAYRTLAKLCEVMERDYQLQIDNHQPRRSVSEGRAADMEHHSGIESLMGWIKRECLEEMRAARGWQALHQVMQHHGLELRERGNGLVVVARDGTAVKASSLSRAFSKPSLEAQFGQFEASLNQQGHTKPQQSYQKSPIRMRMDTTALYARYQAEQKYCAGVRAEVMQQSRRKKDRAIDDAKRANKLRRSIIDSIDGREISKKLMYFQASASLLSKLDAIHKEYAKERKKLYQDFRQRTWADWLKSEAMKGNAEALLALRAREAAKGLQGHTLTGKGQVQLRPVPEIDNVTKKGTIIYRAGKTAVRDDGNKLEVSNESDYQGLKVALHIASEKYGSCITVTGNAAFKSQIVQAAVEGGISVTFSDPILEQQRQVLVNPKESASPNQYISTSEKEFDITKKDRYNRPAGTSQGSMKKPKGRSR